MKTQGMNHDVCRGRGHASFADGDSWHKLSDAIDTLMNQAKFLKI